MNEPCDPARGRPQAQHNVRYTRAHTTAAHPSPRTDDDTHKHTRPSGQRYRSHGEHDRASSFQQAGIGAGLGLAAGNRYFGHPAASSVSCQPLTAQTQSIGTSVQRDTQQTPVRRHCGTAIRLPERRERKQAATRRDEGKKRKQGIDSLAIDREGRNPPSLAQPRPASTALHRLHIRCPSPSSPSGAIAMDAGHCFSTPFSSAFPPLCSLLRPHHCVVGQRDGQMGPRSACFRASAAIALLCSCFRPVPAR